MRNVSNAGAATLVALGLLLQACVEEPSCPDDTRKVGTRCEEVAGDDSLSDGDPSTATDPDAAMPPRANGDGVVQHGNVDGGAEDGQAVDAGADAASPEADASKCLVDEDGDGFGVLSAEGDCVEDAERGDCDDRDDDVYPDAHDVCDDKDNDCDDEVDEGEPEQCNGEDDDCDGDTDEGVANACGGCSSLPFAVGTRCNNGLVGACARTGTYGCSGSDAVACSAPTASPSSEVCGDNIDNDCDGSRNEADAVDARTWYQDCDGDGYAKSTEGSIKACTEPAASGGCNNYVLTVPGAAAEKDCDDTSSQYKPGQEYGLPGAGESHDLNCDGTVQKSPRLNVYVGLYDIDLSPGCANAESCNCATWEGQTPACSKDPGDVHPAKLRRLVNNVCQTTEVTALQFCR